MAEFTIETSDSTYSYDVLDSVQDKTADISFSIQDNSVFSNTQGFQIKKQAGAKRIKARVTILDSKSRIETNIFPMIDYPDSVSCTFDRLIPLRDSSTATMVLEKVNIKKEFDNADNYEIELMLMEVITP